MNGENNLSMSDDTVPAWPAPTPTPTSAPAQTTNQAAAYNSPSVDSPRPVTPPSVYTPPTPQYQAPNAARPAAPKPLIGNPMNDQPVAVVEVLSVRGVEYTMMMLQVWLAAGALLWLALALANGESAFSVLAFPMSLLVVCLPVFAWLFIRLKKAELADPNLKFDPSKRRVTQMTLIISFAVCLFNIIGLVFSVMQKIGGTSFLPLGKTFLNTAIILLIVGGIFAYFWVDEHRVGKR